MSAAAALARAEAAGARLRLGPDGRVEVQAAKPLPPDVLADLRRWREDVAHLLALRARRRRCRQRAGGARARPDRAGRARGRPKYAVPAAGGQRRARAPGRQAGGDGARAARRGGAASALLPRQGQPATATGQPLLLLRRPAVVGPNQPEDGRDRAERTLAVRDVPHAAPHPHRSGHPGYAG
jgi:hypothetical protein